ncbi:30S ribosomal protein S17 [Candidatus Marinamargulisbacteria bacterium SCGC AG-333-B06]|nr:30S ribosomal protein S17 [Candidatus Marinamargulisbacteria bacterium SCGC AG-333-B06]
MIKNEKQLLAKYLNNSGKNTIRVEVENKIMHSKYKKYIKRTKRYLVHITDADIALKPGDMVLIKSTRRLSKQKSFIFVNKVSEVTK